MTADNYAGNTIYWEPMWHTAVASDMAQYKFINPHIHTNSQLAYLSWFVVGSASEQW
jgi:hypothetical protein